MLKVLDRAREDNVAATDEAGLTLDEVAREGARRMLAAALEAEVEHYIEAHADARDAAGRRQVVRNGRAQSRTVTCGAGTLQVRAPRVNDRRVDDAGERRRHIHQSHPAFQRPYMRRSPQVAEVLPVHGVYLRGLSTSGDEVVREALPVLLGEDAKTGLVDAESAATNMATELGFEYVIRLRGDVYVTNARGERRAAAAWVGAGGRARRLVGARVTDEHEWPVGAVVCVHDRKMDEPWCLVASEATVPTRVLIRYYGKRWGIEAGFRDIKDMRFGMGLSSMHVSRPDRRDRLLLISALAIAVLSLLGAAGERIGYDRWLKANTVKRRTHSLFRQGLML